MKQVRLIRMRTAMSKINTSCEQCGRCCYFEIPITLLDVHRAATHLGISDEDAFARCIQDRVSTTSSLYMVRKTDEGACIFLTDDALCAIHDAKPGGCALYSCAGSPNKGNTGTMPWAVTCASPETRSVMWEQSVAAALTRAYIRKNGTAWNEPD